MNPAAKQYPHFKTEEQIFEVMGADSFAVGRTLLEVVKNMHGAACTVFSANPHISDVAREDWRYRLAVMETLEKVLALPAQARTIQEAAVKQRNGHEQE